VGLKLHWSAASRETAANRPPPQIILASVTGPVSSISILMETEPDIRLAKASTVYPQLTAE